MRHRWAGTAAAVILLIAFWALFWPKRDPAPAQGKGTNAALPDPGAGSRPPGSPEGEGSNAAPGADPVGDRDRVPMPGCWGGLRDFDRNATLADMRAAVASAVASGDPRLADYLRERLAEMIGSDPKRALEVLGWAKNARGPELATIMGALKDSEAVRDPSVAEKLLATGETKTESLELRGAALDALETQYHLDSGAIGRMKEIALDDDSESAGWMATRAIGRVMKEDFSRTGNYQPYWKELLSIGRESGETATQLLALEMPSYADPVLEGGDIEALSELLRKDPDRSVREMAAHRLSVTREPERVLGVYRAAFPAERDECVRWAIFRFTVRVAGAGALPMLADFAKIDRRFAQDHQDFMELYASGTVDFARIWTGKAERHQCVLEEGMDH